MQLRWEALDAVQVAARAVGSGRRVFEGKLAFSRTVFTVSGYFRRGFRRFGQCWRFAPEIGRAAAFSRLVEVIALNGRGALEYLFWHFSRLICPARNGRTGLFRVTGRRNACGSFGEFGRTPDGYGAHRGKYGHRSDLSCDERRGSKTEFEHHTIASHHEPRRKCRDGQSQTSVVFMNPFVFGTSYSSCGAKIPQLGAWSRGQLRRTRFLKTGTVLAHRASLTLSEGLKSLSLENPTRWAR